MNFKSHKFKRIIALFVSFQLLSGCATNSEYADPRDPMEGLNRSVYSFNDSLDRNIFKPVAEGYVKIAPQPVQRGISNFFDNLEDIRSAANNLLQLKIGRGLSDISRVLINSTLGVAGLMDIASTEANIPRYDEDFGQTLGYWGVEAGPYLVLPLLGSSTLRDVAGLVGDWYSTPVSYLSDDGIRIPIQALESIELRAQLLSASSMLDTAALDPYAFARDAYLQRREDRIYDGNPPLEFDEDLFK